MPKAQPLSSLGQAPLVRRLCELGLASSKPPKRVFADRLADLIDISDAIALADFFKLINRVTVSEGDLDLPSLDVLFRQHRAGMKAFIDASFSRVSDDTIVGSAKGFRLPAIDISDLSGAETSAAYQRFYALHQSELERRCVVLKTALISALRHTSVELAQLAAVDAAFESVLLNYSRRTLAKLPKLAVQRLAQRLQSLPSKQALPSKEGAGEATASDSDTAVEAAEEAWLWDYHEELRRLLHAELALRLQPLEGMLRCLPASTSKQDDS